MKPQNNHRNYLIYTNSLFILPFSLDIFLNIYWHGVIVFLVIALSHLYHTRRLSIFEKYDMVCAYALMISNAYLWLNGSRNSLLTILILFCVSVSFFFYKKAHAESYHFYHSLWHIMSVIITLLCIISYIL